jgi:hypothetical protein
MLPLVEVGGVGQFELVVVEEVEVTDVAEVREVVPMLLLDPLPERYPFAYA